MPFLTIRTNVKNLPNDLLEKSARFIAKLLDKPYERVTCCVASSDQLFSSGSPDPCVLVELKFAFQAHSSTKERYSHAISDFINKHLSVHKMRIVINFVAVSPEDVAINGMTLANVIKAKI